MGLVARAIESKKVLMTGAIDYPESFWFRRLMKQLFGLRERGVLVPGSRDHEDRRAEKGD